MNFDLNGFEWTVDPEPAGEANMKSIGFICKFCEKSWTSRIYAPGLPNDALPIRTYCSDECRVKHVFEELSR